jgi:hypothetical protein
LRYSLPVTVYGSSLIASVRLLLRARPLRQQENGE